MKNLKRVLSLGLASVMLLGMMVVGASAKDFTDAEKIVNSEAVQVLVALKVVNGKEDGSYFDPEGTVTRGEMAKMIAVAMNGGSEANTGVKGTPSFTDIGGHWAEGWIEYCVDMGIIGGRGDGTFDPNGLVTGTEALKMVLTAMGYDAVAYKLQGAGWAAQTLENARKTGNVKLTEGLDTIVMTEPATRDTAARMIWNGLQAYTVDINPDKNTSSGETTWQYRETTTTLLKQRYDADVATGTYKGNENYIPNTFTATPAAGQIGVELKVLDTKGLPTTADVAFPSDMSIDNIGEEVKVVWKDSVKGTKGTPDKNDTIFGVFNTGATRVERTVRGKVNDQKTAKAQIKLNGVVCDVADEVMVMYNYDPANGNNGTYKKANGTGAMGTLGTDAFGASNGSNSKLTDALKATNGDTIKACFNDDGKVDQIYITETKIAAVTAINSVNITMNNGVSMIRIEGNDVEEGLEKGDVVTVTTLYKAQASNTDAYSIVKKAEKVSGEVEGYLAAKDDGTGDDTGATENITLSGKKYTVYNKDFMLDMPDEDNEFDSITTGDTKNTFIGKDFDLYLVNGYVGAAVKTSSTANNYSVITEVKDSGTAGATFSSVQLQVMGSDGTKEIITVSKDSLDRVKDEDGNWVALTRKADGEITCDDYAVGDIITYSFDKDDYAEVTMEQMVSKATSDKTYNETTKIVGGEITTADCVLYVQTNKNAALTADDEKVVAKAEWEAYNIRDLDDIKLDANKYYTIAKNSNGTKAVAVFMDLGKEPDGASDDTVYGIVTAQNGRIADYYYYTVQSNGEEYEIKYKSGDLVKGNLVKFRPTANDTYGKDKVLKYVKGVAGDAEIHATIGWAENFSTRDNTLTYWDNNTRDGKGPNPVVGKDKNGNVETDADKIVIYKPTNENATPKIYGLAKDAVVIYIDANAKKSAGEASVDKYSEVTGKENIAFTTKVVDNETVIDVLFVETSTRTKITDKM